MRVGLLDRRAEAHAARVAVLDDRAGRQAELLDEPRGGVDVEQVVERELLAAVLRDHREQVTPGAGLVVVRRRLVRVLAVGEVRDLDEVHQQPLGQRLALGEPVRDRGVVAGGVRERLGGELALASRCRRRPTPRSRRAGSRSDRGRTTHTAPWFFAAARIIAGPPMSIASITSSRVAAPRGDAPERVQVDGDEVDRLDAELGERAWTPCVVAPREEGAVHPGVQRLDAALEHLRDTGDRLDPGDRQAELLEERGGPRRRDQLDAALVQTMREAVSRPVLSETDMRARPTRTTPVYSEIRPSAIARTVSGRSRCSTAWIRARKVARRSSYSTGMRSCARTGPVSTPPSTTNTVTPVSRTPAASASSRARAAGKRRQQRRVHVDHATGKRVEEARRQEPHEPRADDQRRPALGQPARHRGIAAARSRCAARSNDRGRDARCGGALERAGLGPLEPTPTISTDRRVQLVEQRLQVRAGARDEHADTQRLQERS